ncbi:ABC transporter permease [Microbacterium testaceum]|uniref:ABC transporter permease n=1 Tax=Microbacterium testaceum TaxID=2033 RepID=UPI0022DF6B72|nr:ABC transporter permease [Microbacterium testaceum]
MSAIVSERRSVPRVRAGQPLITAQEVILVVVIASIWVILGFTTPAFLTPGSIQPLLVAVAPIALIGVGMTCVIITAGIDVSVGAIVMVAAVTTGKFLVDTQAPLPVAVLLAMGVGALLGALNGVLTAYGRVHAIIVTFGTANLFQFLGLRIFDSSTVNGIPSTFEVFGRGAAGSFVGVPISFAISVAVVLIAWWYLRNVRGGRHLYAIGGNAKAARLIGIRTQRSVLSVYVLTGALAGLAACFVIAQGTSTLDQSVGAGLELKVIAAVVIGGTSILGGRGSVLGTLLGAVLVQTVTSGVTQLGWPSQLSDLLVGVFIIIAVGADIARKRLRSNR